MGGERLRPLCRSRRAVIGRESLGSPTSTGFRNMLPGSVDTVIDFSKSWAIDPTIFIVACMRLAEGYRYISSLEDDGGEAVCLVIKRQFAEIV